jgi:hypothetical protein
MTFYSSMAPRIYGYIHPKSSSSLVSLLCVCSERVGPNDLGAADNKYLEFVYENASRYALRKPIPKSSWSNLGQIGNETGSFWHPETRSKKVAGVLTNARFQGNRSTEHTQVSYHLRI